MKRASRLAVGAAIVGATTALVVFWPGAAGTDPSAPGNEVIAHALDVALGNAQPAPHEQPVSGGVVQAALEASGHVDQVADAQAGGENVHASGPGTTGTLGCQNRFESGGIANVRVKQDCSLRR